jgi:hypothetical protein
MCYNGLFKETEGGFSSRQIFEKKANKRQKAQLFFDFRTKKLLF